MDGRTRAPCSLPRMVVPIAQVSTKRISWRAHERLANAGLTVFAASVDTPEESEPIQQHVGEQDHDPMQSSPNHYSMNLGPETPRVHRGMTG